MSLASNIGSALIGAGGKAMEVAVTLWNSTVTGPTSLLNSYLNTNPAQAAQAVKNVAASGTSASQDAVSAGIGTAFNLVGKGSTVWNIGMAIGAALVVFYFFAGWLKNAINVRDDITLDNIWKFVIRVMLIEMLLVNIPGLVEEFMTLGYVITNEVAGNVQPLPSASEFASNSGSYKTDYTMSDLKGRDQLADGTYVTYTYKDGNGYTKSVTASDLQKVGLDPANASSYTDYLNNHQADKAADDYGYFCGIQNRLETEKTSAGGWLSAGGVCLVGGLLGALVIIVSTIALVTAVISRLFRVLISIPFAPAAIAGFAGGQEYAGRGMAWIRSFIGFLLEAVVILLAINVSGALFSAGATGNLIQAGNGTAGVLASIMNMVIPVTVTTAVAGGADTLIRKIIGF